MRGPDIPLSVRSFLDSWLSVILLGLVVLSLVGGYITYDAYVDGGQTVIEEKPVGTWTVDSNFEHSATVQRETTVFEAGERLDNRPLYFTTAMSELDVTYAITHDNTAGKSAEAAVELRLVSRSVEEADDETVVHWESSEKLATVTGVEIANGNTKTETVSIDIPTIRSRIETIEEDLEASPGETEVLVVADAEIESSVGGEQFTESRTDRLEVTPGESVYRVTTTAQDQRVYEATEQIQRTTDPPAVARFGGPLVVLVGLVGMLVLVAVHRAGKVRLTERERTRHTFETDRRDFDEWISNVSIPDPGERTVTTAETLADLVDIAIDSDRRVLEDGEQYAVLVGDMMYTYRAPKPADPLTSERQRGTVPAADHNLEDTDPTATAETSDTTQPSEQSGTSSESDRET
ncbi:hypothetical protein Hrd1104_09105 [Halorhabdus sp. CBA1104]|uniref:DUF5305 domain-containing protein n=1 Tax=Halorhabdus sp. CBA1104 TaxID=1380432 RepID=UPI0012B39846|nr:DUF5305 domain-containing protein [Halorhabdus sp. CBA1104]QGN07452.1 hypothetical protein Hrd1104_09105 [Halorhabdus sp. CBA1104]